MARTFYAQVLREWNWPGIVAAAEREEPIVGYDGDRPYQGTFLGTVFAVMPSGKYYTPWACSNVTEAEANRDERYFAALERAAAKYGGFIFSGEGDPCDLFFGLPVAEIDEVAEG